MSIEEKPKRKPTPASFVKGKSGNYKGRPKGSKNKKTLLREMKGKDLKAVLNDFFSENLSDMLYELANHDHIKKGGFHAKYDTMCKLLQFVLPTMKATESKLVVDKMSESDLDQVLLKIMETSKPGKTKSVN